MVSRIKSAGRKSRKPLKFRGIRKASLNRLKSLALKVIFSVLSSYTYNYVAGVSTTGADINLVLNDYTGRYDGVGY